VALPAERRAIVVRAELHRYLAVLPLPRNTAHTREIINQILAPSIILALHTHAVVHVDLTEDSFEAVQALAGERVLTFDARAIVETRRRGTLEYISVAKLPRPSRVAAARV
jgi:hypothetical protein